MNFISDSLKDKNFIYAVFSNAKTKTSEVKKVQLRPVLIKGEYLLQFEYFVGQQVKHKNMAINEAEKEILELINHQFKQVMYYTGSSDYQILQNKKGKLTILEKPATKELKGISHNHTKNYLIEEGKPCDFLIELGIMGKDGMVHKNKYSKFRQINRFLELVENVLDGFQSDKRIKLIDFGCGKSYLTFAMYYYLVKLKGQKVDIIGLDLKKDVIEHCNQVAEKLDYEGLKFYVGDIRDYDYEGNVDVVFTLHACDIATDAAFLKAIQWNAQYILSVPCCQHEFFSQMDAADQNPILKHGILKEKMASMVTDASRGLYLEAFGYEVDIMEFIDMEHTPKNILIKASKVKAFDAVKFEAWKDYLSQWGIQSTYLLRETSL